jgi:hypothetical protein
LKATEPTIDLPNKVSISFILALSKSLIYPCLFFRSLDFAAVNAGCFIRIKEIYILFWSDGLLSWYLFYSSSWFVFYVDFSCLHASSKIGGVT